MKRYYCKNGECVYVTDIDGEPDNICVEYQGKKYKRPRSIIGKTLFPPDYRKNRVKFESVVDVKREGVDEAFLRLFVAKTEFINEYHGMGGSYYGAKVTRKRVISDDCKLPKDRTVITAGSPLGKAMMGKKVGDVVTIETPDKEKIRYKILFIKNEI